MVPRPGPAIINQGECMKVCVSVSNCRVGLACMVAMLLACALPAAAGAHWTVGAMGEEHANANASSVSCSKLLSECAATGGGPAKAETGHKVDEYAVAWNANKSSFVEALPPLPTEALKEGNILWGVSCTSGAACTAVGQFTNKSGESRMLADTWNGTKWSLSEPRAYGEKSDLHAVSCTSGTECIAVGAFTLFKEDHPLAEKRNGTKWEENMGFTPKPPSGTELYGVSCTSSSACTAVGKSGTGSTELPVAYRWTGGKEWEVQTVPAPKEGGRLKAVSCSSATSCVAVGSFGGITLPLPLAESWNGTS